MRITVTGAAGRFGHALAEAFRHSHSVEALGHQDADITRADEMRAIFARIRPEVVVHPAGIPDLDICAERTARKLENWCAKGGTKNSNRPPAQQFEQYITDQSRHQRHSVDAQSIRGRAVSPTWCQTNIQNV